MNFFILLNLALSVFVSCTWAAPALWAKVSGGRRPQDLAAQAENKQYVDGDTLVSRFFDLLTDFDLEADFTAFVHANLPDID